MVLIKTGNSNLKRLHKRLANTNACAVQINFSSCLFTLLAGFLFIYLFIYYFYLFLFFIILLYSLCKVLFNYLFIIFLWFFLPAIMPTSTQMQFLHVF